MFSYFATAFTLCPKDSLYWDRQLFGLENHLQFWEAVEGKGKGSADTARQENWSFGPSCLHYCSWMWEADCSSALGPGLVLSLPHNPSSSPTCSTLLHSQMPTRSLVPSIQPSASCLRESWVGLHGGFHLPGPMVGAGWTGVESKSGSSDDAGRAAGKTPPHTAPHTSA